MKPERELLTEGRGNEGRDRKEEGNRKRKYEKIMGLEN